MSTQTLYEVLTLKGGQWMVDSTYSNLDGAIEVARGLHGEKHYDGVKVIKENFDAVTGDAKETVIYDSSKVMKPRASAQGSSFPSKAEKNVAAPFLAPATSSVSRKSGNNDLALAAKALVLLVVILAGGIGVLFGVDYLTALLNSLF